MRPAAFHVAAASAPTHARSLYHHGTSSTDLLENVSLRCFITRLYQLLSQAKSYHPKTHAISKYDDQWLCCSACEVSGVWETSKFVNPLCHAVLTHYLYHSKSPLFKFSFLLFLSLSSSPDPPPSHCLAWDNPFPGAPYWVSGSCPR